MQKLQKSLKIKISVSILWVLLTLLMSGGIAGDSYSGFSLGTFLAFLVLLNLPLLVYWLGFWIWDDGYIFNAIGYIFKTIGRLLRFLKIEINPAMNIMSVIGVVFAFLAAGIVASVMRPLGNALEGSFSGSDSAQRDLEGIGNFFIVILMIVVGTKVYKWIVRDENLETKNALLEKEKDPRRPVWQAAIVFLLFVGTLLWLTVVIYGFSSDGLVSMIFEAIGAFVGAYILIALISKFSKWHIEPKNRQYVAAFLVMISLLGIYLPKISDSRDAMDFVIETKQATSPDEYLQIVHASKTKTGRSIATVLDGLQEASKILTDLDDERFSEALSPETLRNPERLLKLQEIAKQKKSLAEQAPDKIEHIYQSVFSKKEELSSKMPAAMQPFWASLLKNYSEQRPVTASFINAYVDFYDNIIGLYGILLTQSGSYSVSDKSFVAFDNSGIVDSYNSYLSGITDASDRIRKVKQAATQSREQAWSKMQQGN